MVQLYPISPKWEMVVWISDPVLPKFLLNPNDLALVCSHLDITLYVLILIFRRLAV
jgi:hypothetical protein